MLCSFLSEHSFFPIFVMLNIRFILSIVFVVGVFYCLKVKQVVFIVTESSQKSIKLWLSEACGGTQGVVEVGGF